MKIIFLGTPNFAVPTLRALKENFDVVAVVTNIDKPQGRSEKPVYSPIKKYALENGIPVYQFAKIRVDGIETLKNIDADVMVTCAYGQILSKEILDMKKFGVINVHGSLLPKYRGASPIQWAIINGEKETGITILKSDVGIDDGDVILSKSVQIDEYETAGELFDKLSFVGAECIVEAINQIESGTAKYVKQDSSKATVCKMFKSDFGKLDFNNSATDIVNLILGLNPSPIAFITLSNNRYKIYRAKVVTAMEISSFNPNLNDAVIGEVVVSKAKQGLIIKAKEDFVSITEIQGENGKIMDIKSFLNGKNIPLGMVVDHE